MSEIIRKSSSLYEKMNKCTSLKYISAGTKEQIWTLGLIRRYEKGEIILRAKEEFLRLMDRDFSLVQGNMGDQERKIWRLSHQLKNTVGSIYMERKLAAKLWKLARDFGIRKRDGIEIDVNISVTFLADMLGTPRETASRLCRELIRQGFIKIEKKRVTVRDPERLAHFYKTGQMG